MTLRNRITPQQLEALRERRITGRQLAKDLGVSECWLSRNYSAKVINKVPFGPVADAKRQKKELAKIRKAHLNALAARVVKRELSIDEAAKAGFCAVRTIWRYVEQVKNAT
jgi:hypothetical protein